jgi:NAD kinase
MRMSIEHEADDPRQSAFVAALRERYADLVDDAAPDVVVVVGGDGAMLRAIRRHTPTPGGRWAPPPLLGIGRGTVNFLMNGADAADRLRDVDLAAMPRHRIHPLWVEANGAPLGPASNDVVVGGGIMDWHSFRLDSPDGSFDGYEIRGGGICVATPIGSTAFNANNGGAVLPLDLPLLSVTGIVANRDLNEVFAGDALTLSYRSRRPLGAHLDGQEAVPLGAEGTLTVRRDPARYMELLFVDGAEFARRRIDMLKAKRK